MAMAKRKRRSTGIPKKKLISPKKNDKPEVEPEIEMPKSANTSRLNNDLLRIIAAKAATLGKPTSFPVVHPFCEGVFLSECSKRQVQLDAHELWSGKNPFINRFYNGERKGDVSEFHRTVRKFVDILESVAKFRDGMERSSQDSLENFTASSLGWLFDYKEAEIRRCSPVLQKRLYQLLLNNFQGTKRYTYAKCFLRPSRFLKSISNRLKMITVLDLGDMRNYKATKLNTAVFPHLSSLLEFTWHTADLSFVSALPSPHKLKSINVTFKQGILDAESLSTLLNCQGVEKIYTGFPVPVNATRFDLDVLLRSYQAFWNQRQYIPSEMLMHKGIDPVPLLNEDDVAGFALQAFPRIGHLAFWNAPEYIFTVLAKLDVALDILQFGQLSQDLNRLCSFDSLVQALFKFNQPQYEMYMLNVKNLKLNMHAMPIVTLDYYLPQLMKELSECMPSISTLELFVHCNFGATMPSSWCLEGRTKKAACPKLENLTDFSLHINGFCVLDELDACLPSLLSHLSLSFVVEEKDKQAFLKSYKRFVKRISDINHFPDLESISIQVVGVRCFESLLNCVVDNISGLRSCSILAMPVRDCRYSLIELIRASMNTMPKLKQLGLLPEMIMLLHSKFDINNRYSWRNQVEDVNIFLGVDNTTFVVKQSTLPLSSGFDSYKVQMHFPEVSTSSETFEGAEDDIQSSLSDDLTNDSDEFDDEEDSFVHDDDRVDFTDEEEDELDIAERKLKNECQRRHNKYQQRDRATISSSDGEPSDGSDDNDVVVFKKGDISDTVHSDEDDHVRNAFIDDQAVESDGSEDSVATEPDGVDLEGSDDEELFMNSLNRINREQMKAPPAKRRKIIVSESD